MKSLCFASTNQNKYSEISSFLQQYNMDITFCKLNIVEIQSDSLEEIAREKCRYAFSKIKSPVIVEDDGLFIDKLNGFPGQYSAFVFKTIGIKGILELLRNYEDRSAYFTSIITYCKGREPYVFSGKVYGWIKEQITDGGWGYDPIFIPNKSNLTFGQLHMLKRKQEFSHRSLALTQFVEWFKMEQNYK